MKRKASFGPFVLNIEGETLERHGLPVKLAGQPMRILVLLVEKAGELATREELREHIWGEETFVDFEQGLNTAVNRLRQALGDSADAPLYIETVPGRGYRFVAPVTWQQEPAEPREGRAPQAKPHLPLRNVVMGAVVAALLVALAWAALLRDRTAPSTSTGRATEFLVEPPVGFWLEPSIIRQSFDLAPDGSSLVFTARGRDGRLHTWRRDIDDATLHPVGVAESAQTVFWGPDSERLFFARGGSLRVGTARGGPFRVLNQQQRQVVHGVVVGDQVLIMANRRRSFLVPLDGGEPEDLDVAYSCQSPCPPTSVSSFSASARFEGRASCAQHLSRIRRSSRWSS